MRGIEPSEARSPEAIRVGMVILWGLGDQKPEPHEVQDIRWRPAHGYQTTLRPVESPYASVVMLYPHRTYGVISIPRGILQEEEELRRW